MAKKKGKQERSSAEPEKDSSPAPSEPVAPVEPNAATAAAAAAPMETDAAPKPALDLEALALNDLRANKKRLERSVTMRDTRLQNAVTRSLALKTIVEPSVVSTFLTEIIAGAGADASALGAFLQSFVSPAAMEVSAPSSSGVLADVSPALVAEIPTLLPEVRVYVHLLVLVSLVKAARGADACRAADALAAYLETKNRFTLAALSAKAYFYVARAYELDGRLSTARTLLMAAHRTASLRGDDEAAAVVLNCLLRSYCLSSAYDQAFQLVSKCQFPMGASSNQLARFSYYVGRIHALRLNYADAFALLEDALRKSPQTTALGFRQEVLKLMTVVQLLTGELPDKVTFRQPAFRKGLRPYLALTQAVRVGDLVAFNAVVETHAAVFAADRNTPLIKRISHNVIKTGLRKITLAYSRITLGEIAAKVGLESAADAEAIVAKAIRDGVMEATINHVDRSVAFAETENSYRSNKPLEVLFKRIDVCMGIHNDTVRAMRFTGDGRAPIADEPDEEDRVTVEDIVAEMEADADEEE